MKMCFTKNMFLLLLAFMCPMNVLAYQSSSNSASSSQVNATPETSAAPALTDISKKLDSLDEKIKDQSQSTLLTILSSFFAAFLGAGIALYTSSSQRRSGAKSLLLDSLKWFEGGIQKRAIGISIIDGNWKGFVDLKATWISVLASQAVYILSKSYEEEKGKPVFLPEHEFLNLERIIKLLNLGIPEVKEELLAGDPTTEVNDAFAKAINKHTTEASNANNKDFLPKIVASQKRIEDIKATF